MFRRTAVFAPIVVAAISIGGCSSGHGANSTLDTRSSASAPTLSPPPAAAFERDALDAYRGLWDVFTRAAETSDAESSELRKYASGQALKLIASSLYTDQEQKQVTKGKVQLNPAITAATPAGTPSEVTITDCVSDVNWLKYKADGALVDDVPGGRHATTATVKKTSGGWKVETLLLREVGTC